LKKHHVKATFFVLTENHGQKSQPAAGNRG
jgi:peptidoglycan/xylan/chitin deacetylase (PgdA/CDA1 family)